MAIGFTDLTSTNRIPDRALSQSTKPRVQLAKFGDGYEQRLSTGINPLEETYDVSFVNRARAEADDIIAFFESKKGATNFSFTIPDTNSGGNEKVIKVVCDTWSLTYENAEGSSISATFRRVYEP